MAPKTELPPIPKLERPEAITTRQGIETLRCYMGYVVKTYGYKAIYPFTFDDMFHSAYAFLLERVDDWEPELSNFDTWATEMLRYGWLYAVREMHWAKYRLIDKQHLIEGRRVTRFGVNDEGEREENDLADQSDDFGTLLEDTTLEWYLSMLTPADRHIGELLLEGYQATEIDTMLGMTTGSANRAKFRIARETGLERPAGTRQYDELTEADKRQVLEQYKKLGSYRRVTNRLNIHHHAVGKVVREAENE